MFSPMFQVQRVVSNGSIRGEEIVAHVQKLVPSRVLFLETRSIFLFKRNQMEQLVLEQFPEVENVRVFREFPSTLALRIIERKEVAQWCTTNSCFALDNKGIIFKPDDSGTLMKISSVNKPQDVALGERVLDTSLLAKLIDFQKRVEQIDLLKQANIRVLSSGIVSNARVSFSLSEGWKIFFNPEESLDWQITKLRLVLEKKIPAEKRGSLEYIDVRFGNQAYLKYR
ncbi:MAG: hypothetical protein Greene071421_533 [Parcubacteria group bacterium Greene0714_21]|nr:MAG: hypothetical protein Greene071421_533 [Parcubacteria group bacterium Greene0714_21]